MIQGRQRSRIKEWYKKLSHKWQETSGASFIDFVVVFLILMIVVSAVFEYIRIQIVGNNLRDSFERAVLTVSAENHDEVYAGFREVEEIGGLYEGGSAGGGEKEEIPEWIPLRDLGDVEGELEELLYLEQEGAAYKSNKDRYKIMNIQVDVRNHYESDRQKYEVRGTIMIRIPIYFLEMKIVDAEIPIKIRTAYTGKY